MHIEVMSHYRTAATLFFTLEPRYIDAKDGAATQDGEIDDLQRLEAAED